MMYIARPGTEIAIAGSAERIRPIALKGGIELTPLGLNSNVTGVQGTVQGHAPRKQVGGDGSFENALQSQIAKQNGVKLSAHAQKRLAERNVQLTNNEQARLDAAVDRVQQKGADKSLVLMDDLALVVSARNRIVITALDSTSARDGVFTNIDSAVIA